ncbi:FMN-binding protein [Streptomyces lycii]|uniref:FMN-binding protein n=1 Tax=Streptomyces lycii TaxID=2654337 RepID=UPI00159E2777|nr:FMN-binding protein [Streptomyces lycii]
MRKHPIRRLLLTSAATVSGVVLLLALKSPSLLPGPAASDSPPPAAAGAQPAPGGDASAGTAGGGQAGGGDGTGAAAGGDGASQQGGRTLTGDPVRTQYGTVQVRLTLADGRITGAEAVRAPSGNPRSDQLTGTAVPVLGRAAVAAQSADIDTVSGATYTSEGYIASLQSALDRTGG